MSARYGSTASSRKALILGIYGEKDGEFSHTKSTSSYLSAAPELGSTVTSASLLDSKFKQNSTRLLHNQEGYAVVCFTHIGASTQGYDESEDIDMKRENIRAAISKAMAAVGGVGVAHVDVDCCGDPEAAAESACLSQFYYDDLKKEKKDRLSFSPYKVSSAAHEEWTKGEVKGDAQNLARWLMESPANMMTPDRFCQVALDKFESLDKCAVTVRGRDWIEEEKMGAFLAVAKGSKEEPKFLQVDYNGVSSSDDTSQNHVAFVGKGVTFDSGGISIKPAAGMEAMRADMGGAACTLSTVWAAAKLGLPVNLRAYMPLCENMPSGAAVKPGDVVRTRSNKTVQVDNTDAEGRLLLADALHYACEQKPVCVVDNATLTGAIMVALGAGATGMFTNSAKLWDDMRRAGQSTGDRVWRMPLYKLYKSQISQSHLADLNNIGNHSREGGSCTAAAFLHQFVDCDHWTHLDIAGVMENSDQVSYLSKGMSGRPTRTLIEFLEKLDLSNYS